MSLSWPVSHFAPKNHQAPPCLTVIKTLLLTVFATLALTTAGKAQPSSAEPQKTWIALDGRFINLANIARIDISATQGPSFYEPTSKTKIFSLGKSVDLTQLRLHLSCSPEWAKLPLKRDPTREVYVNLNYIIWIMPFQSRDLLSVSYQSDGSEGDTTDDPATIDRILQWVSSRAIPSGSR